MTTYTDAETLLDHPEWLNERYHPAIPAVRRYLARALGPEWPRGHRDRGGRWYPSDAEWRDCCRNIRRPSRTWPNSLFKHCMTLDHCARLEGVEPRLARGLWQHLAARQRPASTAPDLCPVCSAPWTCEHRDRDLDQETTAAIAELRQQGIDLWADRQPGELIPVPPERADMNRHLARPE